MRDAALYFIEDNIPMPPPTYARGGPPRTEWTRTLDLLRPGQSLFTGNYDEFKAAERFAARARGKRFTIRKIPSEGWRIWRTE